MKKLLVILLSVLLIGCQSSPKSVHFITYGDDSFKRSRERIEDEAKRSNWFASIQVYTPEKIPEFIEKHREFFSAHRRGGGYWLWKPYVILKSLEQLSDGECLVYADAGCTLKLGGKKHLDRYLHLLDTQPHDVLCFQTCWPEKDWSKGDLLDFFGIDPSDPIMESGQIAATALIIRKSPESVRFVNRWIQISENYHFIDDSPSITANSPTFAEHRHDQSILSLLAKTEGALILADELYAKKLTKEGKRDKKNPFPISTTRKKG